jgi:hypothetical protein
VARLSFRERFIEPIRSGEKRQTLRKSAGAVRQGELVDATCRWGDPPFAKLRITEVETVHVDDLTEHDALLDGFESRDDMLAFLAKTYGAVTELVRIRFDAG